MKATQELPPAYYPVRTLDMSKDRGMLVLLNLVGLGLFFLFGWLFLRLTLLLRPEFASYRLTLTSIWGIVALLVVYAGVLVLHELVHGLFFWLVTRERPHFGFKGVYAYASAPGWFISRNPYLAVGLSPLVVISVLGIALIPFVPLGAIIPLLFALTANASGAVGDLATTVILLSHPPVALVRDTGDAFTVYQAAAR